MSKDAIADANSAIVKLLTPSLVVTPLNLRTACHSTAFANASVARFGGSRQRMIVGVGLDN